jgi:hypothetical protein
MNKIIRQMNKRLLFILVGLFMSFNVLANNPAVKLDTGIRRFAFRLESNFMKVSGTNAFKAFGLNGSVQFEYFLNEKLFLGAYVGHMSDMSPRERFYQFFNDTRVYDLSTSRMTYYGVSAGYKLWSEKNFHFFPDFRIGMGHYSVDEIFQPRNVFYTLRKSIITLTPRANFSYRIKNRIEPGLTFSYLIPIPLNGTLTQYDLGNISSGVFVKFLF